MWFVWIAAVALIIGASTVRRRHISIAKLLWVLAAAALIILAVNGFRDRNAVDALVAIFMVAIIGALLWLTPNKIERT
ncbi:hypothetical protein [Rhodococcus sp. ARC_M6]|uniref:hypothetical protein n=1 Tax=Rhodococcus sp. ARC_M6 TaxID=2928852 RepID=UPI001FB362C4|nr:hypothetical protein [Rhodococcus sp. ARC_M6]MCJ0907097.1 hypothetical protein [Rhodococcus sp. ARC_M6]